MEKAELQQIAEERASLLIHNLFSYANEEERESVSIELYTFNEDVEGLTSAYELTEEEAEELGELLRDEYIKALEEKGYSFSQNGEWMEV